MKKLILIVSIGFLFISFSSEAKITPYFKLGRAALSTAGALYFGKSAYSWHEKAHTLDPQTVQGAYAQTRFYISAIAAVFFGVQAFMAVEKSLEELEK